MGSLSTLSLSHLICEMGIITLGVWGGVRVKRRNPLVLTPWTFGAQLLSDAQAWVLRGAARLGLCRVLCSRCLLRGTRVCLQAP